MRARLASESGVAAALSLGVLAILSIFVTGVLANSISVSDSSERDKESKQALAAAEAGLQQATFRLNRLSPSNGLCVTDIVVTPLNGMLCPEVTEDVGDGARVTFRVTPILTLADSCAGLPVQTEAGGQVTIAQRCVTATGTVNGRKRRVQARVAAFQGNPIFPLPGIIGVEGVEVKNNALVNGWLGSNAQINLKHNNGVTGGVELGPGAPDPVAGFSDIGNITRRTQAQGGWVLAPVEIGNSAVVNDNARISNGLANPKLAPYDASSGVGYNPTTRVLTIGNNSTVTLGGGTYNFCNIAIGNNSQILIAPKPAGQPQAVRIFVDSPYRQGSGCGAGTGHLTMGQGANFGSPPGGDPRNLQVYVYGWSTAENPAINTVEFNNSGWIGSFYAPQSNVVFNNSAELRGGLSAKKVEFKNNLTFNWADSVGEIRARTLTLFYRTAWKECTPEQQGSDPNGGC